MAEETLAPQPGGGRRILGFMVVIAIVMALVFFFFLRSCGGGGPDNSFSIIYSHLDLKDAANVVARLKELKIPYEIREKGTAVAVPKGQVDDARLGLAEKNLPKGGSVGWEIFDESKLGATDFDRRIQLIRAISGELSRTIRRISAVDDCWVQIVIPETRLFEVTKVPVTASVLIKFVPGERLSPAQINGIIHLVASSVENLDPKNVVIVDENGRILTAQAQKRPFQSEYGAEAEREILVNQVIPPVAVSSSPESKSSSEASSPALLKKEQELKQKEADLIKKENELQKLARQSSAEAGLKILNPEEKALLRLQAKGEYENQLTQKCQFILNQFFPPNAVIVKISVEVVLPQTVAAKSGKKKMSLSPERVPVAKEGLEVKRIHAVVLVDNRLDLTKSLKKTTYTTVAAAVGYDKKRGDRIIIRRVPFHFALSPAVSAEVGTIKGRPAFSPSSMPGAKKPDENFWIISILLLLERATNLAATANWVVIGPGLGGFIVLVWLIRLIRNRRKNRFNQADLLNEEEELPASAVAGDASGTLESMRQIVRQNPERLANLIKSWLSEEGTKK